jgi:hypothetical protein
MNFPIMITFGKITVDACLSSTECARKIAAALPIRGTVNTWGEEIYFEIPVNSPLDATRAETVSRGDIGYWPAGRAFCVFFGPTPASRGDEIRPASAVNIVGRIAGNTDTLLTVRDGEPVIVEAVTR